MPIDASIYSNVQNPAAALSQFSPLDSAEKGMHLSQLGMQQAQMGYQMRNQGAIRQAYANNTDPQTGQLNREGLLSQLGKTAPMAAEDLRNQYSQHDKQAAEAQTAQMQAAHQTLSLTTPALQYLLNLPSDQAARAFPNVMGQLKAQGVPMNNVPSSWDRGWALQTYVMGSQTKEGLENKLLASNVGKAPAELQALKYGPRSANAELTGQYDKQVDAIRKSQDAMNQMLDNYKNPSPQGYASLKLNAFRIKFPNAPDVNSLDELSKSQGATDQMKAWVNQYASGMDQATMDNLMRDGISTYRSKMDTLRGVQKRIQARQSQQGVNDPTLTYDPALEKTYGDAMDLQKHIGPYVPPAERGGMGGAISKFASNLLGLGGGQSAMAATSNPIPNGMIRMQGPDGKTRLIPESSKGEAIAAGGKVVK